MEPIVRGDQDTVSSLTLMQSGRESVVLWVACPIIHFHWRPFLTETPSASHYSRVVHTHYYCMEPGEQSDIYYLLRCLQKPFSLLSLSHHSGEVDREAGGIVRVGPEDLTAHLQRLLRVVLTGRGRGRGSWAGVGRGRKKKGAWGRTRK